LAGVVGGGGESAIARGAARAGTKLILSTQSSESIERVAAAAPGSVWFQLYPWRDEAVVDSLVERAESAGSEALVITIDVPVVGNRVRDLRNGAVLPPRLSPSSVLDALRHPRWMKDVLLKRRLGFANLGNLLPDAGLTTIGEYVNQHLVDPSATWAFVQRIRSRWTGTLIIKGVTNVPDSQRAVALGADGLVVSNHGGRQLDGVASTISILPSVVDAVGDETVVLLDGGVRTGSDVAKALAMGARACLIGRPYLWGSAIAGQDGVVKVLDVLQGELSRTLALLGCTSIADLGPEFLDFPAEWSQKRVS
jgi:isopentenyl diphosphate isomerase/L-lactate dehydrogenase-like FMN-dependent dehydrogenase